MTINEIIYRLQAMVTMCTFQDAVGHDLSREEMVLYNEAKDLAVNNLKKFRWIPVREKMPPDSENVLFCDIYGDIRLGYHYDRLAKTHFTELGSWEIYKNIVCWMPLPEPYEVEE